LHGSGALLCSNTLELCSSLLLFYRLTKQSIRWILVNALIMSSLPNGASTRKILVFGGNGFLGGEAVAELLALNVFEITVVNRGNWKSFDSNIRIRPFVKSIRLDRCVCVRYVHDLGRRCLVDGCSRKSANALEELRSAIGAERFDAVIDFSAYDSDVVKDALEVLQDQIRLYVYISSDSVYEVSDLVLEPMALSSLV
jgi:nucleoside-diphosphate-sugar epimerase